MILCLNCLEVGAKGVPVGHDKGSQRDPYRESVYLCDPCARALLSGDFVTLAYRNREQRTVKAQRGDGEVPCDHRP